MDLTTEDRQSNVDRVVPDADDRARLAARYLDLWEDQISALARSGPDVARHRYSDPEPAGT
jgi:hypothetical protein